MAQFDRIYKLTIGVQGEKGFAIEGKANSTGIQITFDVSKDLTQQTNKATIKLYNLSDATAKLVEKDDAVVILEVGYSEESGLKRIYVGYITEASTAFQNSERITTVTASDGQIAIRNCVVSLAYADAVSRKKVIEDVAKEMGLVVNFADDCEFTSFANGFSFIGAGKKCLDKVCTGSNLTWSIQNNMIQVIKIGGTTKVQAIKLSAESGLIGFVEYVTKASFIVAKENSKKNSGRKARKQGYKVKCLLQPTLNPGDLVYIDSRTAKGWFKIDKLTHNGDYMGSNWYTNLEVHEIIDNTLKENTSGKESIKSSGSTTKEEEAKTKYRQATKEEQTKIASARKDYAKKKGVTI